MFAQARSWGPRALAWISALLLLAAGLICAWTGFVMAWDTFGERLARDGARLMDVLPILSEPLSRIFAGDEPVPSAFFFVNLFIHIGLPLAMGVMLRLHVSRLGRATLLPPKRVMWSILGALAAASVLLPAPLGPAADPFRLARVVPADLVAAWWLPISERLSPDAAWTCALVFAMALLIVPRLARRPRERTLAPSIVDPRLCTGCNQCPQDCPWEAITMVKRDDDRPTLVARVDPSRCALAVFDDFARDVSAFASAERTRPAEVDAVCEPIPHCGGRIMSVSRIVRAAPAILATSIMLYGLARLSAAPLAARSTDAARLRLSFSARPARIEVCRPLSATELAEREEHMRQRVECDGRFATYALRLESDGKALHESVVRGAGLRHDRPLYLLREIGLAPGAHRVRISFVRRERTDNDSAAFSAIAPTGPDTGLFAGRAQRESVERARRARAAIPPALVLDTSLAFRPDRVIVVSVDPERRAFRVIAEPER